MGPAPRSSLALLVALLGIAVACGEGEGASAPGTADAGEGAAAKREGFCATRPKLPFCADFDELPLPAPFAELAPATISPIAIDDAEAPSAPRVVSFRATAAGAEAFLWTARIAETVRWNVLFFAKLEPRTTDVEIARVDGTPGPSLAVVVAPDGAVRLDERNAAGVVVAHATPIRVTDGAWSSVRWDVRDDGERSTVRLRFGDETGIEDVPLSYRHGGLTPRFGIGLASRAEAAVAFDTVTFAGGETE